MKNKQDDAFVDDVEMKILALKLGSNITSLLKRHRKHIEKEIVGKINELSPGPYDLASGRVEERDWNGYKQAIDDIISLITKD